ncbi:unnamed protein product, partial [Prorocentrum cordatum]
APKMITTLESRMAGPMMTQQQMIMQGSNAPMTNAGLAIIQVKVKGAELSATMRSDPRDPQAEQLLWPDFQDFENVNLRPGTYAVVKCWGEDFLRMVNAEPAALGEACGHAGLAAMMPVAFAGEVEVDGNMHLAAWTNVSGTYQVPSKLAKQSGLPPNLFWKFVDRENLPTLPDHGRLKFVRGGNALQPPEVSDDTIDRALSQMIGDGLQGESRADEEPPEKRQKTSADFVKSLLFASSSGSSGGGPSALGMARPVEAPEAPAAVEAVTKDPMTTAMEIMEKVATDFDDLPKDKRILVGLVRYLSEAPISNYALSNHHRLTMLLIVEGDRWRAHSKGCFYYTGGCRDQVEAFDIKGWDFIAALEGVFAKIGGAGVEDHDCPDWKWSALQGVIGEMPRQDAVTLATLCNEAKKHSDALTKATGNKGWKGNWALRAVDLMCAFKAAVDKGATRTPLTMLPLKTCDTPKPRSQGVTFTDCYLDSSWDTAVPKPENNCYMRVPYQFFWSDDDIAKAGIDVVEWGQRLTMFLQGLYCMNEPSSSWSWNIVGEANAHYLDCGVFYDRSEWRKSGGAAWNKSIVRIQECDANARMVSDIWKRFIVAEELSCRVNYGFTVQRTFGECKKDQELNYENIPVLEKTGGTRKKLCEQLERRIRCSRMGKATFVHSDDDVCHEEGRFKKIPQDTLDEFLSRPWVVARFLHKYLRPFARNYTPNESLVMLDDIKSLSTEMHRDLVWLASRLSGGDDPPPEDGQVADVVERTLIAAARANTPAKPVVKACLIETLDCIPGTRKPGEKGSSKWQNITSAIGKSNLRLFTQADTNVLRKLMVNYDKMMRTWNTCGGRGVLGDWEEWGNPFDHIDNASTLVADGSVEWYAMILEHLSTPVTALDGVSTTKVRCVEMPSLGALQEYANGKTDRRQPVLDAYIQRCVAHYNSNERLARVAAFPDYIESDAPRCHPRLFKKALQARGLWSDDRFPMIHKFCVDYKKWREAVAMCLEVSADESKVELIKLFYGARPATQLPWLLKLSNEIVDGTHLLLGCAEFAEYNVLYADHPSPAFSRIAAILSHMENDALMVLLDKVRGAGSISEVLIFDGLLAKVVDFRGEAMLAAAVAEASAAAGVEFQIKSWQRGAEHVRFARAVLRGSQTVVVRRGRGDREVANCVVSVADWAQLAPKTMLDEESATMAVKEFNESEFDHSQRDAAKIPQFT